jgi:PhoPQ-activated pathogenicity-related protein
MLRFGLLFACASLFIAAPLWADEPSADPLPATTALDDYVNAPDDSYTWKVVSSTTTDGVRSVVIDMISQTWRTAAEVDRPQWQHWVILTIPENVTSSTGFLMIGGGGNGGKPPTGSDPMVAKIAKATGTVAIELKMIPNQPLIFHGDGKQRKEDDLIGYTWDQFIKTGDPTWPARNPMVKSVVRAMDTVTAFMASADGGGQQVDKFVVAGASKRGWTTWLTGAVDPRVVAIVPIVIDVVNAEPSMLHHFAAYGFWAPAVGNYVQHKIMERIDEPRIRDLYNLVDPYSYRHRLTMPKFVLNAAGDQFFLPDSSQFYWDDLQGQKLLRYVPNTDHGMGGSDALESAIAFYWMILNDQPLPNYTWSMKGDGTLQVETQQTPTEVRLWQATNPQARDFRAESIGKAYTSEVLKESGDGIYLAKVSPPETGWTAYFVELTYDVGGPMPLKVTTRVVVTPDEIPFADKDPSLPTSVTIVAKAPDQAAAAELVKNFPEFAKKGNLGDVLTEQVGQVAYLNFVPATVGVELQVLGIMQWLKANGGKDVLYQLESGPGITLPPAAVPAATP